MILPRLSSANGPFVLVLLVASLGALGTPNHTLTANTVGGGPTLEVNATQALGQAFQLGAPYTVTRILLNVSDIGADDNLSLELRTDVGGVPSATTLASAATNSPAGFQWTIFNLTVTPVLQPSLTYWIVATSQAPAGEGYAWASSMGNSYPSGIAMVGGPGGWIPLASDLQFQVEGFADGPLNLSARPLDPWVPVGGIAALVIQINNTGTEEASAAWANITLAQGLTYTEDTLVASGLNGSRTSAGQYLNYSLVGVSPGNYSFVINASVSSALRGGAALNSTIVFASSNSSGAITHHPLEVVTHTTKRPFLVLAKWANLKTVGRNSTLTYRIYFNNTGREFARHAWINDTLDPKLVLVAVRTNGTLVLNGNSLSWSFDSLSIGPHYLEVDTKLVEGVRDHYVIYNLVTADYTDARGYPMGRVASGLVASTVVAPLVEVTLNGSRSSASPGDTVIYKVVVANIGGEGAFGVYLNDTLDPDLRLLSYTFPLPPSLNGATYSWVLRDLRPGESRTYTLEFQISADAPGGDVVTHLIWASYSDSAGGGWRTARSNEVRFEVQGPMGIASQPWFWWSLITSPFLGLLAYVLGRGRPRIQEAFLVYHNGLLLSHISRTSKLKRDEDILTGMLTAVQNVLREGFAYEGPEQLRQLDLGVYKGVIERGSHVYLAVFYSGRGGTALLPRMRHLIRRVEESYGQALEGWDGDLSRLPGIDGFLPENLRLERLRMFRRSSD